MYKKYTVASSDPKEKDKVVALILNLIAKK